MTPKFLSKKVFLSPQFVEDS